MEPGELISPDIVVNFTEPFPLRKGFKSSP